MQDEPYGKSRSSTKVPDFRALAVICMDMRGDI